MKLCKLFCKGKVRKKMKKISKVLTLGMGCALAASMSMAAMAAETQDNKIVIYATNDVHCGIEQTVDDDGTVETMGYAGVAAVVKSAEEIYLSENVTLIDAGDFAQGGSVGTVSQGAYIVDLMNAVGYDIATLGNHEFDYGMEVLFDDIIANSEFSYVSSNFIDVETGNSLVDAYEIVNYGDIDVAFVGLTTPETFTSSNPTNFQNEAGEYIYSFCEGNDGQDLYDNVQAAIDAALADGAEYVVAIGHMGIEDSATPWKSTDVIANTTGIDVFVDGHSHSTIYETATNEAGEEVYLVQGGTKLSSMSEIIIDKVTGEITVTEIAGYAGQDADVLALVDEINADLEELLQEVVAESAVDLTTMTADGETRAIRSAETNLGNLVADAYRSLMVADVAVTNGGGVRADILAGEITYEEIINVLPFGNEISLIEVTGEQIMQALEMGAMESPNEFGGFLQVSGMTYTINPEIPTPVVTNEYGEFVELVGENRVTDVTVGGEAIDLEKTYTLASHDYLIKSGGDGLTMFKECTIVKDSVYLDNQVLIDYIVEELGGVIGEEYANLEGEGRITIATAEATEEVEEAKWYDEAILFAQENNLIYETAIGTDNPLANADRATVFNALYVYEGSPETGECTFTDIDEESWYAVAAAWAEEIGLSNGDGDGTFQGDREISREEVAAIFVRYNEYKAVEATEEAVTIEFTDADTISAWAGDYVTSAVAQGIMQGNAEGTFAPLANLNIAELATMMMNISEVAVAE